MLYLYPEMLDELLKYVSLPSKLEQAYREHLAAIKADPNKRSLEPVPHSRVNPAYTPANLAGNSAGLRTQAHPRGPNRCGR